MAARKSSRVNPAYKKRYRVRNWPDYEAGLRARGDLEIWFDEDATNTWRPEPTGKCGAQQQYSDTAIVTVLALRLIFNLPLRQAEGFVGSLLRLMDLDLEVLDHTTLSRRGQEVEVPKFMPQAGGPIHLIVDSTGLKIFGAGEWSSREQGKKRRSWRKLHIGVDEEGRIVASSLTDEVADDAATALDLINDTDAPIERFTADGAYDRRAVHRAVGEAGVPEVSLVIPPGCPGCILRVIGRFRIESANVEATRRGLEIDRRHRPARLAARVRVPEAGSCREHLLPIQVDSRW